MTVPETARRFNQSVLNKISSECSLERLMLKLKLQYFGHLMRRTDSLEKTLMLGKIEGKRRRMRWLDSITDSMSMNLSKLLELVQTHVHRVGDAIQPSHPLLSPSPPASILPSMRVFSNESVLHIRWPKYWSFSFSINPSNEYSGLISFRIAWFDFLAVQGTLKSLL